MDYKKFVDQLKCDEEFLKEYTDFMQAKDPKNDEAGYAAIIEFAAAKGYTIAVEDIAAGRADSRKLDENELRSANGGAMCKQNTFEECRSSYQEDAKCKTTYATSCSSTYEAGEHCVVNDECSNAIYYYARSEGCSSSSKAGEWCWATDSCSFIVN